MHIVIIILDNSNMKWKEKVVGIFIGTVNAMFGSGGGLITVPYLSSLGLSQQCAQATSLFVIFPLSILSTILYLKNKAFALHEAFLYLPFGIIGAVFGGIFLKKIPAAFLKILFSLFMIYAAGRMLTA